MTTSKPLVKIIATGGSIAGVGPDRMDYILYPELGEHITIDESLARIPEVADIARIEAEDLISVGSTAIGGPEWLSLANRINHTFKEQPDVAGLVVTHGTATLEETAYFLHLTIKTDKPVVITGAMRPPTSLGTYADLNLLEAVRIAACPEASGMGVLTVLNSEIHCGRDVTKANTFRVETFRPNELGFLGYADSDGEVVFYRTPTKTHTKETEFDISGIDQLPRVDIAYAYSGADDIVIRSLVDAGVKGIIAAGLGSGGSPSAFMSGLNDANKAGVKVVIATQTGNGRVIRNRRFSEQNYIVADNLTPKKARILLMLGLTVTDDGEELQRMMYTY